MDSENVPEKTIVQNLLINQREISQNGLLIWGDEVERVCASGEADFGGDPRPRRHRRQD